MAHRTKKNVFISFSKGSDSDLRMDWLFNIINTSMHPSMTNIFLEDWFHKNLQESDIEWKKELSTCIEGKSMLSIEESFKISTSLFFIEPLDVHKLCTRSYRPHYYKLLKWAFDLTSQEYSSLMGHSWATIRNRGEEDSVNVEFSEKLVHNYQVLSRGIEIFGSLESFNRWVRKFNPFLDAKPIELLKTITGNELVLDELNRLHEGALA